MEQKKSPYSVQYRDFRMEKLIGRGSFGEVWLGEFRNFTVAIKKLILTEKQITYIEREMTNLCEVVHQNVIRVYGICICDEGVFIITDFIPNGDLRTRLNDLSIQLPMALKLKMLKETAAAMDCLHARKIMHRDLKSLNLLVAADDSIRLADFGLSRREDGGPMTVGVGSEPWMAPELLNGSKDYDRSVDVFAFAIVMYEVLTRKFPPRRMVMRGFGFFPPETDKPSDAPDGVWELMLRCARIDPEARPPFSEIVQEMTLICKEYSNSNPTTTPTKATATAPTTPTKTPSPGSGGLTATPGISTATFTKNPPPTPTPTSHPPQLGTGGKPKPQPQPQPQQPQHSQQQFAFSNDQVQTRVSAATPQKITTHHDSLKKGTPNPLQPQAKPKPTPEERRSATVGHTPAAPAGRPSNGGGPATGGTSASLRSYIPYMPWQSRTATNN